jgi:uncharacterized membrane protein YgcG
MYILLCGYAPFSTSSGSQQELFQRIMAGRFAFDAPYWTGISSSAKDLITQLLRTNPEKRATAVQVLAHPWIRGAVSSLELSSAVSQMRVFQHRKRAVLRCGILVKQGFFMRNWKRRFFVLTPEELQYYDPDDIPEQEQLHPSESVADLGKGAVRPKGVVRLKDILAVSHIDVLAPGVGPQFPQSSGPGGAAAAGIAAPSSGRHSSSASDSGRRVNSSRSGGGSCDVGGAGSFDSTPLSGVPSHTEEDAPALQHFSASSATASAVVVPGTASGDFRWGLRLTSTVPAGAREYVLLADSEAARDTWARTITTVNQHGDLLRRAGLAMAMGDAHAKDAVGLMRIAQLWHDTVMSPAAVSQSAKSPNSARRRLQRSRHAPTAPLQGRSKFGAGCETVHATGNRVHVKVCRHTSNSMLVLPPDPDAALRAKATIAEAPECAAAASCASEDVSSSKWSQG